ncbi:uncharacterized protein LOC144709666 [Wolffia australiana]
MAKSASGFISLSKRRVLLSLVIFSVATGFVFFVRSAVDTCDWGRSVYEDQGVEYIRTPAPKAEKNPLDFMRSRTVLLVSHELSLSGGPLLLMELAFLLRAVGAKVIWITAQRPLETDAVIYSLEHKMLDRGVKVSSSKGKEAVDTAISADLIVLNTAVAGKWLDSVLKDHLGQVLPKILWWIHEMRGHYFKVDFVKHLPFVSGAMIDSYATAEYWKNRTRERMGIRMPHTYVVHLGNSKELMEIAENDVAKRILRDHVRESLGVRKEDVLFGIINSVSRGKGQDLFLQAFNESLQMIHRKNLHVPALFAVVVGSDMNAQTKFETELRNYVMKSQIESYVRFVNKTFNVAPYLAAVDILVQNSQGRGECFGRITIEAMAFKLPVLGTAAGGTTEIVVNGSTGVLHPIGKEGISPLARNIVDLAINVERRIAMGREGYRRMKDTFMEQHMTDRIANVFKDILHI